MLRLGYALVLLALAGQAAGVGTIHFSDATGDVSFSSHYSAAYMRPRNLCWAVELECSEVEEVPHENMACEAPPLDITDVTFAVTPDGFIRGSMTLADIDGEISCASLDPSTGSSELHRADHRQGYAMLSLTDEAGRWLYLSRNSLDSEQFGSLEEIRLGMHVPFVGSFCFDKGGWRDGDTIGFEIPTTGLVRRCVGDQMVEYAFVGSVAGKGDISGLGAKQYVGSVVTWDYYAGDHASDPTQRIPIP